MDGHYCSPDEIIAANGDLIEFKRLLYLHYAVYTVDSEVDVRAIVEINRAAGDGITVGVSRHHCFLSRIVEETIRNLCDERGCRVNNLEEAARERGLLPPFPPDVTVERAREFLKGGRFKCYNPLTDNCEHFVTKCRYGEPFSLQVYSCLAPFRLISTLGSTVYNTFFSTNNPQDHALEVIFDEVRRNEERNGEH